jgi:hypothetical protein
MSNTVTSLTSIGRSRLVVPTALRAAEWDVAHEATTDALRDSCTSHLGSGGFGSVMRVCSTKTMERRRDGRHELCLGCVALKTPVAGGDPITVDEAVAAERLTAVLVGTDAAEHVVRHFSHVQDPARSHNPNAVWMTMELLAPAEVSRGAKAQHLADFVEHHYDVFASMPERSWKAMWVQVFGTLAQICLIVPGFQHNDIKPDNIGFVPWQHGKSSCRQISATGTVLSVPPQQFGIKLLDLGLMTASDAAFSTMLGAVHWDAMPPESSVGGCMSLGAGTPMFDVQRAFANTYDLVTRAAKDYRKPLPGWWRRFMEFAERWVPNVLITNNDPTRTVLDMTLVPMRGTPECAALKADTRSAADVLDDAYFAEFRAY